MDVDKARKKLANMVKSGLLITVGRGLYALVGTDRENDDD
jgi:hypothetical protein